MTVNEILELLERHYEANVDLEKQYIAENDYEMAKYARGAHLDLEIIIKEIKEKM